MLSTVNVPVEVIAPPLNPSPVATFVTVPVLDVLLLKVVKLALDKYPLTEVEAAGIDIAGAVPPEETTGDVPDTPVTVPVFVVLLLNVVQSVELKYPD